MDLLCNIYADDAKELSELLVKINRHETEVIPVLPLQEGYKLPVENIYASVIIREDLKYNSRKRGSYTDSQEGKNNVSNQSEIKCPDELFTINGEPTKHIYMQGDAARGKTTYCLWLLKQWCDFHDSRNITIPSNIARQQTLYSFDFVFYLPMRNVNQTRVSITEMICKDVLKEEPNLQETVKHVLLSHQFRCLVIIDGLDEWNPDDSVLKDLHCRALPNFDNISNSVFFFTMRPWKFDAFAKLVRNNDRVVEIKGLDKGGIYVMINKLLVNHFGLEYNSNDYKQKRNDIIKRSQNEKVKSFMQIPLLLAFCVQMWYNDNGVSNSMTSLYTAMVNMLIERTCKKHEVIFAGQSSDAYGKLPTMFSKYFKMKQFHYKLLKLGEVAFEGLLSERRNLVFQKDQFQNKLGKGELEFALCVGLISQREDESHIETRNVRIEFFHRSVQEFLAAFYSVFREKSIDLICRHLSDVESVMELSDLIMFICGMNHSLGVSLAQHVDDIANKDSSVCTSRIQVEFTRKVQQMFQSQATWYRELQYEINDIPVPYHLSDIFVDHNSDIETIKFAKELLRSNKGNIKSIYISMVQTDEQQGITNSELNDFLCRKQNTMSLLSLHVNGFNTERSLNEIHGPSLQLLSIHAVKIADESTDSSYINSSLLRSDLPELLKLKLSSLDIGKRELGISANMTKIVLIELRQVKMSPEGWKQFLIILKEIRHGFSVHLRNTNIDHLSLRKIRDDHHFDVTKIVEDECHELLFNKRSTGDISSSSERSNHVESNINEHEYSTRLLQEGSVRKSERSVSEESPPLSPRCSFCCCCCWGKETDNKNDDGVV